MGNLSRALHDLFYHDASLSLCARAWDMREVSRFWAAWVRVFGPRHCEAAWLYHCYENWRAVEDLNPEPTD